MAFQQLIVHETPAMCTKQKKRWMGYLWYENLQQEVEQNISCIVNMTKLLWLVLLI
jgi:hypothetical protein